MNEVTNGLAGMAATAAQVVSAINAWNVVALGMGAALTHAYHRVVAAGGGLTQRRRGGGVAHRGELVLGWRVMNQLNNHC